MRLHGEPILIVMSGEARLDNRKYKDRFGAKAKMLDAAEVVEATGHPVGGVCPFGLPRPLRVFADVSLRAFDVVVPAAGDTHAAVRITPGRLAQLAAAEWVDVAQDVTAAGSGGGAAASAGRRRVGGRPIELQRPQRPSRRRRSTPATAAWPSSARRTHASVSWWLPGSRSRARSSTSQACRRA